LMTRPHTHPYYIQWLNNSGKAKVTHTIHIHFSIRKRCLRRHKIVAYVDTLVVLNFGKRCRHRHKIVAYVDTKYIDTR
jgi:hypothetical protein